MKPKAFFALVFISVAILVGTALVVFFKTAPSPEEKRQIEILSGQLFVFNGTTNELKRFRTMAGFCRQHEIAHYFPLVAGHFERYRWPKDRPVQVREKPDKIIVTWPVPPEALKYRWRPDFWHQVIIDKKEFKVISTCQGG